MAKGFPDPDPLFMEADRAECGGLLDRSLDERMVWTEVSEPGPPPPVNTGMPSVREASADAVPYDTAAACASGPVDGVEIDCPPGITTNGTIVVDRLGVVGVEAMVELTTHKRKLSRSSVGRLLSEPLAQRGADFNMKIQVQAIKSQAGVPGRATLVTLG